MIKVLYDTGHSICSWSRQCIFNYKTRTKELTKMAIINSKSKLIKKKQPEPFAKTYISFCKLYNTPILTNIIARSEHQLFLHFQKLKKEEELEPIVKALKKNSELEKITFYQEDLSDKKDYRELILCYLFNFRATCECLLNNKFIKHLDISGIILKEASLKNLEKGLLNHKSLKYLSLSRCKIGDSGIYSIFEIISFGSCIEVDRTFSSFKLFVLQFDRKRHHDSNWLFEGSFITDIVFGCRATIK